MTKLFIATGDSFARVREHNAQWKAEMTLEGKGIQCLAADARNPGTLYAGSRGQGFWKSMNEGDHWENLRLPHSDVFSAAVSPVDGTVYAGCEPSMLFRSKDNGKTWEELASLRKIPSAPTWSFPPRPWTSHVRWIAPSPRDAGLLLAGIELGGLMRSEDAGETWQDHRPGAQRDVHALAWHPRVPDRAYEAAGGGAAWSFDGGRTWKAADVGRDRHYTWALAVNVDDPNCWYISASPGPYQAHSGNDAQAHIYRWSGDGPWRRLAGGLPQPIDSMPYALVYVDGNLFAGLRDGRIYTSGDDGDSWRRLELHNDSLESIFAMGAVSE